MKILVVLSILLFGVFVIAMLVISLKKRNKIENIIKRTNSYSIYNINKRKKMLFNLTEKLTLEKYIEFINRDSFYFRGLLFYDLKPHVDLSFKENTNDNAVFTETEWKKNMCSQNSLMRKRALNHISEYSYLNSFIKERFEIENDPFLLSLFLEEVKVELDISDLIKKIKNNDDRKITALIFERLWKKREELEKYENNIKSINNSEYTVLFNIILYPEKFVENIIFIMENEEDDTMFSFLNSVISEVNTENIEILDRLISITEKFNDKNEEELSDLSSGNFDTPRNLYLLIYEFENFDNITKDYIVGKILRYNSERLTGALISAIIRSKDNSFGTLIEDIVYNTDSLYLRRLGVLGMKKLGMRLNVLFLRRLLIEDDIEILYNIIPIMKESKDAAVLRELKRLIKKNNPEIKTLVKNT